MKLGLKKILTSIVVAFSALSCATTVYFPYTPNNVECAKRCMLMPQKRNIKPCHFRCDEFGCDARCNQYDFEHIECLKSCNIEIKPYTERVPLNREP